MSFTPTEQFNAVIAAIDAVNAEDPRKITVDGKEYPYETVYAERMTEMLERMYPDASELLRIAARAQHIRRWQIPRDTYPRNREGYQKWRLEMRQLHADLVGGIMRENGYSDEDIALVGSYLRKERLKREADSQALENVVDVVFLAYYWDEFIAKFPHYDDDKLIDIVGKTLRKMSSHGHQAALALDMPSKTAKIVMAAVEREKDTLAAMAAREAQ
ncbi:DUF4202 domain-containing protein [Profundibacter amoris]|uniref:DUF4202 domain-containing protein n=1 Tax=Profundibacter amoris TaxID=2171755 RepID=A0A347UCJ7_9RHOB|nr:DUF4202 domain-containing protein [Profundibacter amoris]AXX96575.1 DUF4202 domain-containing protein [Profundibacter amoris]